MTGSGNFPFVCGYVKEVSTMKYVIVIVRVLLGLMFVVFGSNAFFKFMGPPPQMQGQGGAFITAMISSGYMYVVAMLQVLGGLCLLLGARFVPLGLTLLGPVIVNIVLFHLFLEPTGTPISLVTAAMALFLLWIYRFKFPAIFQP
jgi:putative oxidoreductase